MKLDYSALRPSEGEDSPSDLTLDRLNMGLLSPEEAQRVEAQLRDGGPSAERYAAIQQGFAAFPDFDERPVLARVRPERRRQPWIIGVLTFGAAAAAVALFALRPSPPPGDPGLSSPGVRTKGAAALRIYRKPAGGEATEVLSGSLFAAGDRIRFSVDVPSPGPIAIYGWDGSSAPYLAWPAPGQDAQRPAGEDQLLDGAAELDDAPGPEHLFLVHCPGQPRVERCQAAGASLEEGLACADACTISRFVITKAAGGRR